MSLRDKAAMKRVNKTDLLDSLAVPTSQIVKDGELTLKFWSMLDKRGFQADRYRVHDLVIDAVEEESRVRTMVEIAHLVAEVYRNGSVDVQRPPPNQDSTQSKHVIDFARGLSFEDALIFILELGKHADMQHLAREVWEWFKTRFESVQARLPDPTAFR